MSPMYVQSTSPQFPEGFSFAGRCASHPGHLCSLVWSRLSRQSPPLPTASSQGPSARPEGYPIPATISSSQPSFTYPLIWCSQQPRGGSAITSTEQTNKWGSVGLETNDLASQLQKPEPVTDLASQRWEVSVLSSKLFSFKIIKLKGT